MQRMCLIFFCQQLLGVDGSVLKEALTHKKIVAKGEEVITLCLCLFCLVFNILCLCWYSHVLSISRWTNCCLCVWCVWFQMISPLSLEQALSARDSLAKAIYGRAFTWLVQKLNQSLAFKVCFFFLSMKKWAYLSECHLACTTWSLACIFQFWCAL